MQKKSVIKGLVVFSSIIVLGLTAACSKNKPDTKHPNVLVKANLGEPPTLDPQKMEALNAANIGYDLYEGLTVLNRYGDVRPGLAKSWTISPNGLTYTFHLRNAKWSNGKPVTAQDFVYSLRRFEDPHTAAPSSYLLYPVKNARAVNAGKKPVSSLGVSAPNAHEVVIKLEHRTPYLLSLLSNPQAAPVYAPDVKQWGDQFTRPGHLVSTGAYELKDWVVNGHITLVRNPNYWNAKTVHIAKVKYLPLSDENTVLNGFKAGQIDWTYVIPSDQYASLKKDYPSETHSAPGLGTYYYNLNVMQPPFKGNLKLRKALSMAVDRETLVHDILGQGQPASYAYMPYGIKGIDRVDYPWAKWPRAKQIAEAKKLYHEAGYSKAHPLQVTIKYNTDNDHKKIAIAIAAMWQQVLGVQTKLENEEWKVFVHDRDTHNFEISRGGWVGDYNFADTFLPLYECHNVLNSPGYCNPVYDRMVAKAMQQTGAQRKRTLSKAIAVVMQGYSIIPLFQWSNSHMINSHVKGYSSKNLTDAVRSKDLRIVNEG